MSTTAPVKAAATKRTASTKAAPKAAATAPTMGENETPLSFVIRLAADPTAANVKLMLGVAETETDSLRFATFTARVQVSAIVGWTLVAAATVELGHAPTKFPEAAKAVGVTENNGETWTERAYSTLKECYDISTGHTNENLESFTEAFREAHGRSPEAVRAYAQWVRAALVGGETAAKNNVTTLATRKAAADKAAKAAAETAAKNVAKRAAVAKAVKTAAPTDRPVACIAMTLAQWNKLSVAELESVEMLAANLRVTKAAAERAAAKAAKSNEAAAETGPKAAKAARTKVSA